MRFGTPGTKSPEIWYPMEYYIPERDLPIRGYGTPQRNGTPMAGSSCEDISISGGHDPRNCTWSDIRRCLYTVSIQLTLLSAKIMYNLCILQRKKKGSLRFATSQKKIRNVCYMYSYNYYKPLYTYII